jgi:hypothetical protein
MEKEIEIILEIIRGQLTDISIKLDKALAESSKNKQDISNQAIYIKWLFRVVFGVVGMAILTTSGVWLWKTIIS